MDSKNTASPALIYDDGSLFLEVECKKGFTLANGSGSIPCFAGDYNKKLLPTCLEECEDPPILNNSVRIIHGPTYARVATYSCDSEYAATSTNLISTCYNGAFSKLDVQCRKLCPPAPDVLHANSSKEGNSTDYIATYVCDENYSIASVNSIINCTEGIFVSELPVCEKNCPDPPEVNQATKEVEGNKSNQSVRYTCNEGYHLSDGNHSINCINGEYVGNVPTCVKICSEPHPINNTRYIILGELHERVAVYSCVDGFVKYSGDDVSLCIDGEYIGRDIVCVPQCPTIYTDAHRSCLGNQKKDEASLLHTSYKCSCQPGMLQVSETSKSFMCTNGTFSGEPLRCEPPCPFDLVSEEVTCEETGAEYSKTVNCSCNQGYTYQGGDKLRNCTHGLFNGLKLLCAKDCPANLEIANTTCLSTGNDQQRTYNCTCQPGFYSIGGKMEYMCIDGVFTESIQSCQPLTSTTPVINTEPESTSSVASSTTVKKGYSTVYGLKSTNVETTTAISAEGSEDEKKERNGDGHEPVGNSGVRNIVTTSTTTNPATMTIPSTSDASTLTTSTINPTTSIMNPTTSTTSQTTSTEWLATSTTNPPTSPSRPTTLTKTPTTFTANPTSTTTSTTNPPTSSTSHATSTTSPTTSTTSPATSTTRLATSTTRLAASTTNPPTSTTRLATFTSTSSKVPLTTLAATSTTIRHLVSTQLTAGRLMNSTNTAPASSTISFTNMTTVRHESTLKELQTTKTVSTTSSERLIAFEQNLG